MALVFLFSHYLIVCFCPDQDVVQPRFLVVINPYSGSKQSVKQYKQNVQPFFEIAGVTVVEELITGDYLYNYYSYVYINNIYKHV